MISGKVLVLNKTYLPVHVTSIKRACVLLYQGIGKAIDEQYQLFTFDDWIKLPVTESEESIGLVNQRIKIPRVLVISSFEKIPKRPMKFARYNIYIRDNYTCQYCGKKSTLSGLNLDHIVPRSKGGISSWQNVVCSCVKCNRIKGGRTPEEAKMHLIKQPTKPNWTPFTMEILKLRFPKEWLPFLTTTELSLRKEDPTL